MVAAGAKKIFLMNGHGGNDIPVRFALRELKTRFPDPDIHIVFASYWHIASKTLTAVRESKMGGMGHACEMETSIMMHLHPDLVRMDLIRRDGPKTDSIYRKGDMQQGPPVYECSEFHEISETGTVGYPDMASAEKGRRFLDGIVEEVAAFIRDFQTW
jgi:creatinine amidohydrolase